MDVVHATFSPSVSTTLSRVIIYRPPTVSPYVRYFTEHHEDGAVFSIRSVIGVDNPTQLRKDDLILIKLKSNFIFTAHFITQCDSQKENGGGFTNTSKETDFPELNITASDRRD